MTQGSKWVPHGQRAGRFGTMILAVQRVPTRGQSIARTLIAMGLTFVIRS